MIWLLALAFIVMMLIYICRSGTEDARLYLLVLVILFIMLICGCAGEPIKLLDMPFNRYVVTYEGGRADTVCAHHYHETREQWVFYNHTNSCIRKKVVFTVSMFKAESVKMLEDNNYDGD